MYATLRFPMALLAGAALAVILPVSPWVALGAAEGVVALLLLLDAGLAPPARSIQLRRQVPDVVAMGRPATAMLRLHNPTGRRLTVAIRDGAPPSMHSVPPRHSVAMAPGGWADLTSELRPTRRGRAVLGPPTVRTQGPLGLGGRQATLALTSPLKVYPPLPGRAEVELRLDRARLLQSGRRSAALRGGGTDFDSLRDYRPDDEFRRINWRATARAAKPISNDYREERNQQVILMLDAGRTMAPTVAGVSRFEFALDAAVALAELASRVGDQVGMVAFGKETVAVVEPRGARAQAGRILELLFDLEPTLDAPDYTRAFASLLARHRRRALLVLLTELSEEAVLEPLLGAVPVLLSRHLLIVGSVSDPDVERLSTLVPSSSQEAYLKAAAAGTLANRTAAAGRLRRLGAVVVDASPGYLAGGLADQYLRIKAYGRL